MDALDDDEEIFDAALFDVSDVTWKVHKSKRAEEVTITFYDETPFNLLKIRGALLKLQIQIEEELNCMEEDGGEH